ncbi:MAG: hypothetical protein HYU36_11625 [Planctomycetes bacterium]|nr:hypothetical protein [Planctomycetota bacterium]
MANEEQTTTDQSENVLLPDLAKAYDLLQCLLEEDGGIVSTQKLRKYLEKQLSIDEKNARGAVNGLKFLGDEDVQEMGRPEAKIFHQGWNFYSAEKYREVQKQTEEEAEKKISRDEENKEKQDETTPAKYNHEETKVARYVQKLLETIYASDEVLEEDDGGDEEHEFVFDVQNYKPGSAYENVDLIAVHWRNAQRVEVVAVEVKLGFDPKAIHQACNYTRFCHRVWVAVCIKAKLTEAGNELRSQNLGLFEYAVSQGLGIIACRRTQGKGYEALPIHWPRLQNPDPAEKDEFVQKYRENFVKAGVIEKKKRGTHVNL